MHRKLLHDHDHNNNNNNTDKPSFEEILLSAIIDSVTRIQNSHVQFVVQYLLFIY